MNERIRRMKGLKDLVLDAVEHGSRKVERFHAGVLELPYAVLERIPATAAPAKVVHDVHLAVTASLYENLRRGARLVGVVAEVAFALVPEGKRPGIVSAPPAPAGSSA